MSKDPAILFYTSDFLTGTMLMSDEQVGKYIRLLCVQHQKGHLSEKDMLKICQSYDEDIFEKFTKDEDGLFFNVILDEVINKRKAYSLSRSKNRKSKSIEDMINTSKTYVEHMENENKDKDVTAIVSKEERVKIFIIKTTELNTNNQLIPSDVEKFNDYWTESGDKDTKLRWEKEKTFSHQARMKRWKANSFGKAEEPRSTKIVRNYTVEPPE